MLLMTKSSRAIPAGATPDAVAEQLRRLAHDLVALAGDMRAKRDCAEWILAEYDRIVSQLPHTFDRGAARTSAAAIVSQISADPPVVEPHDLFFIYMPEDRLPIAAPLAIELAKRRITVAMADYEVATGDAFAEAVEHGLSHHRAGAVLWTGAFDRLGRVTRPFLSERLRVLRRFDGDAAAELAEWVRRFKAIAP